MSQRTEQEILQEARRILRRLAAPRTGLFARGAVFVAGRSAMSASRVTVAADVVASFAAQGWVVPDGPGRYVIGVAGHALLARESQDGFAGQHRVMQTEDLAGEAGVVRRNVGESPLARLKFRDLIDGVQFAAGEKLRRDFTLAQLTPRMGVDLSAPVVSGSRGAGADSITDIAMAARQRLNRALAAVGPGLSDMLFDVCCHLAALDTVETARGWSKRSGRVVLKIALDRLASHYGFDVVAPRSPMRAWSADA